MYSYTAMGLRRMTHMQSNNGILELQKNQQTNRFLFHLCSLQSTVYILAICSLQYLDRTILGTMKQMRVTALEIGALFEATKAPIKNLLAV